MRLGTSTRAVWHLPTPAAIDIIGETGFDHIELWTEYPNLSLDLVSEEEIEQIRQRIERFGLSVSVHAPIRDINLSSSNYGIRKESVRQVNDATRFASKVGAPIVVIHPGRRTTEKDPLDWTEGLLHESLIETARVAGEEDIILAMENMEVRRGEYVTTAESLMRHIEKVGSPYLRATFDVAHANTAGGDPVTFYETMRDYVVHVHLSDNKGPGGKTHSRVGEGHVDFPRVLRCMRQAGYQGALVIEGYDPRDPERTMLSNFLKMSELMRAMD
jgi:sugar phosphate isomerase/epimerase